MGGNGCGSKQKDYWSTNWYKTVRLDFTLHWPQALSYNIIGSFCWENRLEMSYIAQNSSTKCERKIVIDFMSIASSWSVSDNRAKLTNLKQWEIRQNWFRPLLKLLCFAQSSSKKKVISRKVEALHITETEVTNIEFTVINRELLTFPPDRC